MIDYSPSETLDFLMCPQYRLFRKDGWRGKIITPQDISMIVGSSIHAGLAVLFNAKNWNDAVIDAGRIAEETFLEKLTHLTEAGGILDKSIKVGKASDLAANTVLAYASNQRPLWCHKVLAVEERIGHGVIDLICEDPQGNLLVVDHKTAGKLLDQNRASRLKGYQTSWQLRDYLWRVSNAPSRSYHEMRTVRALINLIILEPFEVIEEPINLRPDALAIWERDARRIWIDMSHPVLLVKPDEEKGAAAEEVRVSVRPACSDTGYGRPCHFYAACHEGGLSPMEYIKVERGDR